MGFNGPVDINHQAVFAYMDRLRIPLDEQMYLFDQVVMIHGRMDEKRAEMKELDKAKGKNKQ